MGRTPSADTGDVQTPLVQAIGTHLGIRADQVPVELERSPQLLGREGLGGLPEVVQQVVWDLPLVQIGKPVT